MFGKSDLRVATGARRLKTHWLLLFPGGVLLWGGMLLAAGAPAEGPLREGVSFPIGGQTALLKKLVTLPCAENDYTKRFKFDSYRNPKLKELRERYKLDEVIAAGKDEFDKQLLLMEWTHRQFKKFGQPSTA